MDIFKDLVHEFYSQNLRKVLLASAQNPTICAVITSLLAGDVYKPSMWQSVVKKQGFSPGGTTVKHRCDRLRRLGLRTVS